LEKLVWIFQIHSARQLSWGNYLFTPSALPFRGL
jgi:hypothetical protein